MNLNIYLFFNGNCEEAMNYYKEATGGSIDAINRYGDSPMPCEDSYKNKIMHGLMSIGNTKVMFSDSGEKRAVNFGNNFSVSLDFEQEDAMDQSFDMLSGNGGTVTMPLQDTFWGAKFGMCTDKFGVNWMFNHNKPKSE